LFAAVIAESLGVVLLEPAFDWLPTLPTQYRGREVRLTPLGHARLLKITRFVKPVDLKYFVAKVYDSGDQLPVETAPTDSTPVLISEPVHWEVEYRCFVLERQVAAISPYLRDGKLAQDEAGHWIDSRTAEALHFAQSFVRDAAIELPPGVVVDVGFIRHGGWAVVEANAAWGSGIYGCDPQLVLPVVRRSCLPCGSVSAADRQSVVTRA